MKRPRVAELHSSGLRVELRYSSKQRFIILSPRKGDTPAGCTQNAKRISRNKNKKIGGDAVAGSSYLSLAGGRGGGNCASQKLLRHNEIMRKKVVSASFVVRRDAI